MTWLEICVPLVAIILTFIAYLGGKSAGKKETELKQKKEEIKENETANTIIDNNNHLTDSELDDWLRERSKK